MPPTRYLGKFLQFYPARRAILAVLPHPQNSCSIIIIPCVEDYALWSEFDDMQGEFSDFSDTDADDDDDYSDSEDGSSDDSDTDDDYSDDSYCAST